MSLGGGGTDLPSYYREHGGFLIAGAIDKYVYITIHQTFITDLILKYSSLERVSSIDAIQHPIVREALKMVEIHETNLEITSMADIPAGTGLGSSGSFTTALLKALHSYRKNIVHPSELAAQACKIEIDRLGEPIGKQDQYIAAFGGLTCFSFHSDDTVEAQPLKVDEEVLLNLEDNLLLFFTGFTRSASHNSAGSGFSKPLERSVHDGELALHQANWPGKQACPGKRRSSPFRRTSACPLGSISEFAPRE